MVMLDAEIGGRAVAFECDDTLASRWVSRGILEGSTYPCPPFLDAPEVMVDVGANCGAASFYFAHMVPRLEIHAIEPGRQQREILMRNVGDLSSVRVHPVGLHDHDAETELFAGLGDSGMSSIVKSAWTTDDSEKITVRSAAAWAREQGLERIDVLKVDAEGCEAAILRDLEPWFPTVQLLFVEYDSRADRREIDRLLAPTHELLVGKILLDQGECTYVSRAHAERPETTDWLRSAFEASLSG